MAWASIFIVRFEGAVIGAMRDGNHSSRRVHATAGMSEAFLPPSNQP
jgi:hypothetical protein